MITGHIVRQRLNLCDSHIVADTINYLEAKFIFKTDDWDGLDKWAHFAKDSAVYDIRLTEDCIRKEDHLNLSAGMWKVYLHGNEFRDGEVVQRITTDEVVLYVIPTGTLDGEPFPTVPPSAGEQIIASAAAAEAGAKSAADAAGRAAKSAKDSADLAKKIAEIIGDAEQIIQDALRNAKESGEFDGEDGITPHIGANGNWFVGATDTGIRAQGKDGAKGDPGDDYLLTAEDKQEIAGLIPSGGNVGNVLILVGGTSLDSLRIEFVAPPAGVSVDAAYELIGRGLFDVAVQIYSDDGNDLTGIGILRGMSVSDAVGAIGEFWSNGNVSLVNVTLDFAAMTAYAETMYTSSGGGGVVIIAQDADGSYTCSHTPAEIAEMSQTGAVVAGVLVTDSGMIILPLIGISYGIAMFEVTFAEDDNIGTMMFFVGDDAVVSQETTNRVAPMTGASAADGGKPGTVPAPSAGQQDAVLHGDGTWRPVKGGASVELDATLTQSGTAADAKAVGDKFGELSGAIADKADKPTYSGGNLQIGDDITTGVEWRYADGMPENNGLTYTGTAGKAVLQDGGVLLSPGAEYKFPVLTAKSATLECVLSIPSFATYQYGFRMQLTNGTTGIRISCYLNELRFNQNTNSNLTIAQLEADTEYTLRIEWNETDGANVYLNGSQVLTNASTIYALDEIDIGQFHSGTTLLESVTFTADGVAKISSINGAKIEQKISDDGGYFASDTVERALQEIGAELAGVATLLGNGVFE